MKMIDAAREEGFDVEECTDDGCEANCAYCRTPCPEGHPILWEKGERFGAGYCTMEHLGAANGGNFY